MDVINKQNKLMRLLQQVNLLRKKEFDVTYFGDTFSKEFYTNGFKTIKYPLMQSSNPRENGEKIADDLYKLIKKEGYDIALFENGTLGMFRGSMYGIRLLSEKNSNCNVFIRTHENVYERPQNLENMLRDFSEKEIHEMVYNPSIGHIVIRPNKVDEYIENGIPDSKIFYIPNGINFKKINEASEDAEKRIKERFNIPKEAILSSALIRCIIRKNPEEILLLNFLLQDGYPHHSIITGILPKSPQSPQIEIDYFNSIKELIDKYEMPIHFGDGQLQYYKHPMEPSIVDILKASKLIIMPSTEDNGCRPILEASATMTGFIARYIDNYSFKEYGINGGFYDHLYVPTKNGIEDFSEVGCGKKVSDFRRYYTLKEREKIIEKAIKDPGYKQEIKNLNKKVLEKAIKYMHNGGMYTRIINQYNAYKHYSLEKTTHKLAEVLTSSL